MPRIRDWTYNYHSTTNQNYVTCVLPYYQSGDLLLAICSTDTGTQTWTATGWTQLFSQTNTANLAVMYRIADGTESNPVTFNYTTVETANVTVISIEDVDTSAPFNGSPGYATANTSSAVSAMPTYTTNRNGCLLIYAVSHSGVSVPTILAGPVIYEAGKDGSAHSDGFSWSIQGNAGTTPGNVYCTSLSAVAQKLAVIAVNPPSSGAQKMPAYCAGDDSRYVNPINGTTAYNGDTAFAATATTHFGTSLGGATLQNGTVAALADYGINSYHSVGQLTGVTTSGVWTGATLMLASANYVDVSGKNVLVHVMPSTPKQIQTTDSISKTPTKGIAFGMVSASGSAFRVWHVHGAGTSWGTSRTPCVIHAGNTSGMIQSTGSLNESSVIGFGFFTSGSIVAPVWTFCSLWVLDTCVVCGGNSNTPVDIPGIAKAVGAGHERMSAIVQGAGQLLLMQPVQFGNGGSSPVYMDLNATAIEFPQQYSLSDKNVSYCSVDNVAGITYYAGSGDVIRHRNSVVSSRSKYHWRFHPSSSTSATYDFSGLSVIGAGDVQLKAGITLSGVTFSSCDPISAAGAALQSCTFNGCSGTAALLVSSPSEMSAVSDCLFQNNSVGIQLSAAGTYTFNAIRFSGNTTDVHVSADSGSVVINVVGGGDTPSYTTAGAAVTVNNQKTLTLTGIRTGSEVRIYLHGTETELAGEETNTTGTFQYSYNYAPDTYVDIVVHALGYLHYRIDNYLLQNSDSTIPVAQQIDRQYENP